MVWQTSRFKAVMRANIVSDSVHSVILFMNNSMACIDHIPFFGRMRSKQPRVANAGNRENSFDKNRTLLLSTSATVP